MTGSRLFRSPRAVIVALSLLIAVVLSACGGSSASSSSGGSSVTLQNTYGVAAGPVGSVSWNLPYGEPNTLDPAYGAYYSASLVTDQLCESLLRMGPDFTVSPNLATSVDQVNPLTLVINLRKGVTFWDGHEMTSADVVYSLQHEFSPNSAGGALFSSVKSVQADGPYQVTMHFTTPDELVLKEMSGFFGDVFEKAQAVSAGSKFGSAQGGIMCTGPYQLKKWTPGSSIVVTANPHYWDPSRQAHIQSITFTFDTNSSTMAESLISGQVDGAYEVPAETIPRLKTASNGRLLYGPGQNYLQLYPTGPSGPLASKDLREALFTNINRAALASVAYNGAATPNYTFINTPAWDPTSTAQYAAVYQPFAKAGETWGTASAIAAGRKLVAASGYTGQPLVLATLVGDATLNEVAQLIQQEAKAVGINIMIRALQPIQYSNATTSASARQGLDLILANGFNIAQDPLEPLLVELLPGATYNYSNYSNPKVTSLLNRAIETFDPATRASLIIKAQSIYEAAWPAATLLNLDEVTFLSNRLSGAVTSFAYLMTPSLASIGAAAK